MVKIRISLSIEDKTWFKIRDSIKNSRRYSNKSHFVEEAILNYIEEGENEI